MSGGSGAAEGDGNESLQSMIAMANEIIQRNASSKSIFAGKTGGPQSAEQPTAGTSSSRSAFSRIEDEVPDDCLLPDIVLETTARASGSGSQHKDKAVSPKPFHQTQQHASTSSTQQQQVQKYNVFSMNQSIAAACADPRKSRSQMMVFFTRHWGEHFRETAALPPLYNLPQMQTHVLAAYLKGHQKKHKQHVRLNKAAARPVGLAPSRATAGGGNVVQAQPSASASAPLSLIPQIFLSADFKLNSADGFRSVFMEPAADDNDDEAESSSATPFVRKEQLIDKLESYHDLIESKLTTELAARSSQLFDAVQTYNTLSAQLADTRNCLRKLRGTMSHLNNTVVKNSFSALYLHRSREHHAQLLQKLEIVSNMREAQSTVQMLLSTYNYPAALECIATAKAVLKQDLNGLLCFRHLSLQLSELESMISRMLQDEFVRLLQEELNRPLSEDSALAMYDTQINPVFLGLTKIGEFRYCQVLQEEMAAAAKALAKKTVRDFVADCDSVSSTDNNVTLVEPSFFYFSNVSSAIRRLGLTDWLQLVAVVADAMLLFLAKINTLQSCLLELLDVATGSHSQNEDATAVQGVRDQLALLPRAAHSATLDSIVRVVGARAKDGFLERLTVDDFMRVWTALESFETQSTERVRHMLGNTASNASATADEPSVLRQNMRQHAHAFVARFHDDRKAKLTNILDSETWKAAAVPGVFQCIVDECSRTGRLSDVANDGQQPQSSQQLTVHGDTYVVVGTALMLLQMMAQYCDCLRKMPFASHELLVKLVELLKLFNSRSCQLVLGAGALQLVGLKTITVKNLALCSRCLQLIAYHVPFVERQFRTAVEPPTPTAGGGPQQSNVLRHLQQLVTDLNDHIHEINLKLISLMDTQMSNVLVKWEFRGSVPSSSFQLIGKHIRKFHEGIAAVLPDDQIQSLLFRVHDNFKKALRNRLLEMDITPRDTTTWGLVCSEFSYYMDVLRSVDCCASLNDTMNDVLVC